MKKEKTPSLWIWGFHPVNEFLLKASHAILEINCLPTFGTRQKGEKLLNFAQKKGFNVKKVADFNKFFNPAGVNHQGICALIENIWEIEFDDISSLFHKDSVPFLVMLDGVTDPQNLGAIIRSCAAMGVQAILLPERGSVTVTSAAVRVSSGAISRLKICYLHNTNNAIDQLKEMGIFVFSLTPEAKQKIWEANLTVPLLLILGAEGEGIRHLLKKKSDNLISIPISNLDSLNVGSSCGIALYETMRQRDLKHF